MNEITQIKKFQLYTLALMAIISPIVAVTTYANKTEFAIERQGIISDGHFSDLQKDINSRIALEEKEAKQQSDLNFMYEKRLTSLEVEDKAKFQKIDAFLVRVSEKLVLKY